MVGLTLGIRRSMLSDTSLVDTATEAVQTTDGPIRPQSNQTLTTHMMVVPLLGDGGPDSLGYKRTQF